VVVVASVPARRGTSPSLMLQAVRFPAQHTLQRAALRPQSGRCLMSRAPRVRKVRSRKMQKRPCVRYARLHSEQVMPFILRRRTGPWHEWRMFVQFHQETRHCSTAKVAGNAGGRTQDAFASSHVTAPPSSAKMPAVTRVQHAAFPRMQPFARAQPPHGGRRACQAGIRAQPLSACPPADGVAGIATAQRQLEQCRRRHTAATWYVPPPTEAPAPAALLPPDSNRPCCQNARPAWRQADKQRSSTPSAPKELCRAAMSRSGAR